MLPSHLGIIISPATRIPAHVVCQVNLVSQSEDLPRQQRFEVMNWSYLDLDGPGEVAIFYGL